MYMGHSDTHVLLESGNAAREERQYKELCADLTTAWRQEDYGRVVMVITQLAHLVGRFPSYEEGERVLRLGIQACRAVHDPHSQARFLSRLACLRCAHDRFEGALQAWQEGQAIAQTQGYVAYLWEPILQVAHIADLLGTYDLVESFAAALLHTEQVDDPFSLPVALFIRGFHARALGEEDRAYHDFTLCLRLCSQQQQQQNTSSMYFFLLLIETELARTQGAYIRARGYSEAALALARTFCDPYMVTALLSDQACFAYQQGMFSDAYSVLHQLLHVVRPTAAAYHERSGRYVLSLLTRQAQQQQHVSLSPRERAVLQLVADGLSTQEIANTLVIANGTVKKHMEHIYRKLDARNRTHALAKARALHLLP